MNMLIEHRAVVISAIAVLCLMVVSVWLHRLPKHKLGYGVFLSWSEKMHGVVVLSRLKNSPAHKKGIVPGMILISADGVKLNTKEAYKKWIEEAKARVGVEARWVLEGKEGNHVANIVPSRIKAHFPAGPHPDETPLTSDEKAVIKVGLVWSEEVDMYIPHKTIRTSAIRQALGLH